MSHDESGPADHPLTFHSFDVLPSPRGPTAKPIVWCPATGAVLELDALSLFCLERLAAGDLPSLVAREAEERSGGRVDLASFIDLLRKNLFIKGEAPEKRRLVSRWLQHALTPTRLTWLRRWPVGSVLALVWVIWIALAVARGTGFPRFDALLLTSSALTNMVVIFALVIMLAALHELAHFAVARSYGLTPFVEFGMRFHALVMQTNVTQAYGLKVRQQVRIFLAGIWINITLAATAGIIDILFNLPAFGRGLAALVVLLNLYLVLFQFFVISRTDLYFVILAVTGSRNIRADAAVLGRARRRRLVDRLFRRPQASCRLCRSMVYPRQPICTKCGSALMPNQVPVVLGEKKSLLSIWSAFSFISPLLMGALVYLMVRRAFTVNLDLARQQMHRELSTGGMGGAGMALLASTVVVLQVAIALMFVASVLRPVLLRMRRLAGMASSRVTAAVLKLVIKRMPKTTLARLVAFALRVATPALVQRGMLDSRWLPSKQAANNRLIEVRRDDYAVE